MKVLAKDFSSGNTSAILNVDADSSGNLTLGGVLSSVGLDFTTQGSRPAGVTPGFWVDNSNVAYFYDTVADRTLLHSNSSFGGDVSGTYGSLTVTKLQGRDVLNAAPNDGDVLTWVNGNSRWEPVAAAAGSWIVLDNSATLAQINTALSSYDIVYLEPGAYDYSAETTTPLTIPTNKQLIGLCGAGRPENATYAPYLTFVTSGSVYVSMGINSLMKGIALKYGASSAGVMVRANTTNTNARILNSSVVGEAAGTAYLAIEGSYKEISQVYIYYCGGIDLDVAVDEYGGRTTISGVRWQAHPTWNNSGNTGIQVGITDVSVSDCYLDGGNRGLVNQAQYNQFSNIHCRDQALGNGASFVSTQNNTQMVGIYAYNTNVANRWGIEISGAYVTAEGLYAYNFGSDGIRVAGNNVTGSGWYAWDCGDASSGDGIAISGLTYSTIGVIGAYGSGAAGVSISGSCNRLSISSIEVTSNATYGFQVSGTTVTDCVFGTVVAVGNTSHGVYVIGSGCTNNGFGMIVSNDNTGDGVNVGNSTNGLHFMAGTTITNGGTGFLGGNQATQSRLDTWYSTGNTTAQITLGSNWLDYSTPTGITTIAAATDTNISTPAGGDLLIWDGTDTWDNKALSGDASLLSTGALTVTGIRGLNIDPSISPSDGQVLLWDNANSWWEAGDPTALPVGSDRQVLTYDTGAGAWQAEWPGIVNEPETQTFIILAAGSSEATINTALTNYDVVYLEPGAYTHSAGTTITVPAGKKLVGLGNAQNRLAASCARLEVTANVTTRYILLQGGILENIAVNINLTTGPSWNAVEGASGGDAKNWVRGVHVWSTNARSDYAFYGYFTELRNIYVSTLNGVNFLGADVSHGLGNIEGFYIYNAPDVAILCPNVSNLRIADGYIEGNSGVTDYGIRITANSGNPSHIEIYDVNAYSCATTGFSVEGGASNIVYYISHHNCRASSCPTGFYATYANHTRYTDCVSDGSSGEGFRADTGAYDTHYTDCYGIGHAYCFRISSTSGSMDLTTLTGCHAYGATTWGYYFGHTTPYYANYVQATGCRASSCGAASSNGGGFGGYLQLSTLSGCEALNCSNSTCSGFNFVAFNYGTATGLTAYANNTYNVRLGLFNSSVSTIHSGAQSASGGYGVWIQNSDRSTVSGISSSGDYNGVYFQGTRCHLSDVTVTSPTGYGVYAAGGTNDNTIHGVTVSGAGNTGFRVNGNLYRDTISGIRVYSTAADGISLGGTSYQFCTFSDWEAATATFAAITIGNSAYYSTITGLSGYTTSTGAAIVFENLYGCAVSGLTAYSSSGSNIAVSYSYNTSWASISTTVGSSGFQVTSSDLSTYSTISCRTSSGNGISITSGATGRNNLVGCVSYGHTGTGVLLSGNNTNYAHGLISQSNGTQYNTGSWSTADNI